jgi:hypothetical protein
MSETLLSISNINLFGLPMADLDIKDPDKPIKVDAVTEKNENLTGHPEIGGVQIKRGDFILVNEQNGQFRNGVYLARGRDDAWEMVKVERDAAIKYKQDQDAKQPERVYWEVDEKTISPTLGKRASTTFSIDSASGGSPSIDTFTVNGVSIIGASPFKFGSGGVVKHNQRFVALINDESAKTMYSAEWDKAKKVITLYAPLSIGAGANGFVVAHTETSATVTPSSVPNLAGGIDQEIKYRSVKNKYKLENRKGENRQLERQLFNGTLARIFGFSYEGTYYDLPRPAIFLVHGDGMPVNAGKDTAKGQDTPARAPGQTSLTGLAAADFDFADSLCVWSYDKADYTIRMDVETGMFEDVLLAAMLGGGPGGMDSAGMNARGMNARGMNARGMNARGMNARGMNARGGGNSD